MHSIETADKLQEGLGTLPVVYDRLFPRHLDKALMSLKYEFSLAPQATRENYLGRVHTLTAHF